MVSNQGVCDREEKRKDIHLNLWPILREVCLEIVSGFRAQVRNGLIREFDEPDDVRSTVAFTDCQNNCREASGSSENAHLSTAQICV